MPESNEADQKVDSRLSRVYRGDGALLISGKNAEQRTISSFFPTSEPIENTACVPHSEIQSTELLPLKRKERDSEPHGKFSHDDVCAERAHEQRKITDNLTSLQQSIPKEDSDKPPKSVLVRNDEFFFEADW